MTIINLVQSLQDTFIGNAVRAAGDWLGAAVGIVHILGLVLLLTAILIVNLRLLGFGLLRQSVEQVAKTASPLFWIGLVFTVFSGSVLFISNAVQYYQNPAFLPKMTLLAFALVFQVTALRKVSHADTSDTSEKSSLILAKSAALISLTLWLGTGFAGRAIGFV